RGNALYVTMLLADVPAAVLTRPGRSLPVPSELGAFVGERLRGLDPDAEALIAGLAVFGLPATLPVLATIAGLADAAAALEHTLPTGLVESTTTGGDVAHVWFAHPLYRQAVHDGLSHVRRRELHRAAAAVSDRRRSLAHRVAAADRVD